MTVGCPSNNWLPSSNTWMTFTCFCSPFTITKVSFEGISAPEAFIDTGDKSATVMHSAAKTMAIRFLMTNFLSCFFAPRGPPEGGDFNRFLSGHAPDKKHFSPCKCASWPPKADGECVRQGAKNRSRSRNDFENEGKKLPPVARGKIPLMPCRPSNNLHKRAGGSPKFCFTASNVRPEPGGLQSADSNRHPL